MIRLGRDRAVMGTRPISVRLAVAGWLVAALTGVLGMVYVLVGLLGPH
jgi:hypothetical protein